MADTTATAHVFPSANDLEGSQPNGWGETIYEKNLGTFLLATLGVNNFVFSGAVLPGSSVNLNITIPSGIFWLNGRYVSADAQAITVGASVTTHLFAKLLKDGSGNVSSVAYETNTSGTAPADSTKIGTLVSSGSAITSTTDARLLGPHGIIELSSGVAWPVPAGIFRIFVEVIGASGGGGGGGEATANDGGTGGAGGTTSFDTLSASGGAAGGKGQGGGSNAVGSAGAAHGVGSGGTVNFTGRGMSGGPGGDGGTGGGGEGGHRGGTGGDGGYTAGYMNTTPNTSMTIAIGAAGTAGAGGTGTGGASANDGGAGTAGLAGRILVHY